ncbi:hypothetical protein G6F68_021703 [Rhizopus microsporus]|nr:hypothetical protein G6F68_021703 [Rhizopus microsporus]
MSSGSSNSRLTEEERDRRGLSHASESSPRVLQLDVRHPKKEWWRTSRLQSQATEPVRGSSPLQNGNY